MAQAGILRGAIDAPVLSVLQRERAMALSKREWKFRLAGYGYAIKEVGESQILTSLIGGGELGILPADLA
ncbi:hypothetical protein [Shimia biformata]|uniref:hypothetical protein n=1 Tax=Shimia biformata TaxID=1294299 RepID=UPI00194FCFD7|nr:hypothetical protein [Shimia biformata]